MILYHYTCRDGARGIHHTGTILPNPHPLLPSLPPLVWLTDLPVPDRQALGLESTILTCDRTEVRITVDAAKTPIYRWRDFAADRGMRRRDRRPFERGRQPDRWYVAVQPIPLSAVLFSDLLGTAVSS
jgi:hypothetical protein